MRQIDQMSSDERSFPTMAEQAAYWARNEAEQERTGGVNDFIEEQQQYSNYENHEL